jgi:hypothetical protein
MVSTHWVNVHGHKSLVAPFGGAEARFTTNPYCTAIPRKGQEPIVLDFATSQVAMGKVRVANNKKIQMEEGLLIDAAGNATTEPGVMYNAPYGAILPFGLHKGGGLAVICDLLAGALTGGLCGFLVWNVSGRLYVGDAGALFVGAALAGLGLELVRQRPDLLFVPPILLLPFLSDVLLTVAWRARHGKKLFVAHRDHSYQIALKAGLKHWQVSSVHAVWALNTTIVGILAALLARQIPAIMFVLLVLISTWLHMKIRRAGVENGLVGREIA